MRRVLGFLVLVTLFAPSAALAQKATLTDDEITAAIATGVKNKGYQMGLELIDSGASFNAAFDKSGTTSSGFSVRVYTPTTWIQQHAADTAKLFKPFSRADVTDDMLQPVLRVIVHADTPASLTAAARANASSVEHAVLRDAKGNNALQPLSIEPFEEHVSNALGAREQYQSVQAIFALDDLHGLRGPTATGEFLITVIGEGTRQRDFQVKKKHFERIP